MSNYVTIKDCVVRFEADEIGAERFRADMDVHKDCDGRSLDQDKDRFKCHSFFYWFLGPSNVAFHKDGSVTIRFGRGRSTHTFRDFDGTVWFLGLYLKKKKAHTFRLMDEGDPGRWFRDTVIFKPT